MKIIRVLQYKGDEDTIRRTLDKSLVGPERTTYIVGGERANMTITELQVIQVPDDAEVSLALPDEVTE